MKTRFDTKWKPDANGCWIWQGTLNRNGYGKFSAAHGVMRLAHRISWLLHRGDIPKGMCVLHTCDVKPCVNPNHLRIGTVRENAVEAVERGFWGNTRGERNGNAKLIEDDVIKIRQIGDLSNREIARRFGVRACAIDRIKNGTTWKHLL